MITHDPVVAVKANPVTTDVELPVTHEDHDNRLRMVELFLKHHFPKEYVAFFVQDGE